MSIKKPAQRQDDKNKQFIYNVTSVICSPDQVTVSFSLDLHDWRKLEKSENWQHLLDCLDD